ncbi:T9SS type A sorting domain-containing protein [Flavobacterium pallidum]|uniref:Secretion system C-terminal sorting domain-containing protein n=1 Tax=Flavobacterium pallidum TaxID=2172098 RepID=A0A2S1SHM8_9FLAO|nr:T9SS type A sorting domain-containing protein [Flavobacterium pallidum]AWI25916.1 hypothetical protein HYN49_08390 [Flavobacterium pallidum]
MKIKLLTATLLAGACSICFSQDLAYDTAFGNNGMTTTTINENGDALLSLVLQPDGKIVSSVGFDFSLNGNEGLIRYNSDGSIDTTFGNNGIVLTSLVDENAFNNNLKLLADGRILIVGSKSTVPNNSNYDYFNFAMAMYLPDGTPDLSFGTNGILQTDFAGHGDVAKAIDIQPDGKIIVAGYVTITWASHTTFGIARYNPDGSLDTGFGQDGFVVGDFEDDPQRIEYAHYIKWVDEKIIVGGSTSIYDNQDIDDMAIAVLRINADGSPDTTFGANGRVVTSFALEQDVYTFLPAPDGGIYAAGSIDQSGVTNALLIKYNSDGSLDAGFGDNGKVIFNDSLFPGSVISRLLLHDGKILCSGTVYDGTEVNLMLMRYNLNGSIDTSFGSNGIFAFDINGNQIDYSIDMLLQPDGKLVMGGWTGVTQNDNHSVLTRMQFDNLYVAGLKSDLCTTWPNPFTSSINIHSDDEIFSADLFDISGRRITDISVVHLPDRREATLKVPEALSNGIYILNVSNGKKSSAIKVIK